MWVLWEPKHSTGFMATYYIYSLSAASYHKLVITLFAKKNQEMIELVGHVNLCTCTNKDLIRSDKLLQNVPKV